MPQYEQSRFVDGVADYPKDGGDNQYSNGLSIDHRSNSRQITLLPKTTLESGSLYTGMPTAAAAYDGTTYIYANDGSIYSRDSSGTHTKLKTVADSHGNGMSYFGEDNFLYYTSDKALGRYGRLDNTPAFTDDFLTSEGGVPQNTKSLSLNGTSQYGQAADSATLSITGDLSLEAYVKLNSLPASTVADPLIYKWDSSGQYSYAFDIYAASGYFGDGSDGALTISSNTTQAPIDSACSGTSGAFTLSATNASFAADQVILIHQTRGTGAGTWQRNKIVSYTAGTITLESALNYSYNSTSANKAQVIVLPQYTNVTVNSGITWTAKAWNGTVGGILAFLANGTVTVTGTISADAKGYLGGQAGRSYGGTNNYGGQGEGTSNARNTAWYTANGNGGGGGGYRTTNEQGHGGGGGGHATVGQDGRQEASTPTNTNYGRGGSTAGNSSLTSLVFGGAGGGGGVGDATGSSVNGDGGNGGGIVFITGSAVTVSGAITCDGANGEDGAQDQGAGGGGAGGSIFIKAQTATLGTSKLGAIGGQGGTNTGGDLGDGSVGRIHLDYLTSYTGTTSPTLTATADSTLSTDPIYQLRLRYSNDGTNFDILSKNLNSSATDTWTHLAVTLDVSASSAIFYQDGVSLGTATGSRTAIYDSTSTVKVGFDGTNYLDAYIDEVRVWSTIRSSTNLNSFKDVELAGSEGNLAAYFPLDDSASDGTANGNNLTLTGSPTYSADVPFSDPTTRLDIDQTDTSSGNTYTLTTAIDEGASHRQTFVPDYDPQKSIEVNIAAKGTGNWTLTVHDPLNREIASKTVTNAELNTGDYEFIFSEQWRPVIGASYHFHLTSTVADGTVVTGTASSLETAQFTSYYAFLVNDEQFHYIEPMLNFLSIGNGRYIAKWDGTTYTPAALTLPSEWKVRSMTRWGGYLVIGCWRGDSVDDFDDGMLFFWDGVSDKYNYYVPIPEGAINAMTVERGRLHIIAGYRGDHLIYMGGSEAMKVKRVPRQEKGDYIEVLPKAMTIWDSLVRYGVGGDGSSSTITRAVYTYGALNRGHNESLSIDYPISTGRTDDNVKIGLVFPVGRKLLIGWQDNVSYGVDVVDPSGDVYATGTIERVVIDNGKVWKEKLAETVRADFRPLVSGESVTIKYKLDNDTSWTELEESTADATEVRLPISSRYHEITVAADLATTASTSPTLLGLAIDVDELTTETNF